MKYFTILLVIIILKANSIFAQPIESEQNEVYPDKYTFEKAMEFEKKGEYEKAIWFYINLYPENKTQVIEIVKKIVTKLDTIDIDLFIKTSFARYGTFDPSITTFKNGVPNMDINKLKLKGALGDEIIKKITNQNNELDSAQEYNIRGLKKAKEGNFKEAIDDFDKAIEFKPTGQFYFNRAYSKSMIEDFYGAIQDYDKTISFVFNLADSYFERGYCKDQSNNLDGAIADYTKSIEINSENADAYNNRAFTKIKQKDFNAAINDFDKAIIIKPDFVASFVNRGFAKKELGDKSGACNDWRRAFELGYKQANELLKNNCE